MLDEWLNPMPVSLFVRDYLHKQPYASPSSARGATPIFGWDTLERILIKHPPDILLVARGKLVELPAPQTLAEARALMLAGVGMVIRRAEQHDTGLAKLAASLSQNIPGEVHVQLFVTSAGTHGFGWHYDDEDVFVVQTDGTKDYFFRDNTIEGDRRSGTGADFSRFCDEASPIGTARLIAGDWLYIPSRWWHVAKCIEDSLSISLGLSPDERCLAGINKSENTG
jgi:50S ribosomal protein L16 3-hydroxylase